MFFFTDGGFFSSLAGQICCTALPAAGFFAVFRFPRPGSLLLYCASRGRADFRLPQPGSSQRAKGECSSPRLREAWLGFQQAFLSWLYLRQYSRGHSLQVMKIQRGQSGGSVFGRVAWGNARRGFTNTVASVRSCAQLYCASQAGFVAGARENAPHPGRVRLSSCGVRTELSYSRKGTSENNIVT